MEADIQKVIALLPTAVQIAGGILISPLPWKGTRLPALRQPPLHMCAAFLRCGNHRFCSELIAAAFEVVGSPLLNPSANVWRITPRDLRLSIELVPISAISIPYW